MNKWKSSSRGDILCQASSTNSKWVERIRPLVGTREKGTRGSNLSEGGLSARVQIRAPSLTKGQEADIHSPGGIR